MENDVRQTALRRRALYRKFLMGCLWLIAIPIMFLILSFYKGAGWAGLVPGMPVYLTLLGGATYQFIKEIRALKQEEEGSKI